MLEVKLTINIPDLATAIHHMATAIEQKDSKPTVQQAESPTQQTIAQVEVPSSTSQDTSLPSLSVPLATAPQYTVEQIMQAGSALLDAGKMNELLELLHSFGVQAVSELKPEQLGAFARAMRDLGATI